MATKTARKSKAVTKATARKAVAKKDEDAEKLDADEPKSPVEAEAKEKGIYNVPAGAKNASGAQGRATGETTLIDRRTGVTYQPVVLPGDSVPLLERQMGQASNVATKPEGTETRITGARVENEKQIVVSIQPGTKGEGGRHDADGKVVKAGKADDTAHDKNAGKHGELHTAQKDTLNPEELDIDGTFTPRQEGARDVDFAVAATVEPDPMGAGRTGAGG